MPLIRNKLEPGDVDLFLEEENFPCQQPPTGTFAGFGHRPIPMFLESKAKRPRKPVKCLCNMLDKDEKDPELLAQSERCRLLANHFKSLGDIRGCVTAYPTVAAKNGGEGYGGIMSEIKRRKSQRWCHYLLPPQRSSADDNGDNDGNDATSVSLRAELLTFDNRKRARKGRTKKDNKKKGRLKDPPPNGSTAGDNQNGNNEENQDSTNHGAAAGDAAAAAAEPAEVPDSNSPQNDSQASAAQAAQAAQAPAAPRPAHPAGIKRRLAFVAWHHFHPLLIQLLCRDDNKRLYRCPDTVPKWLIQRFDDVECTYRNRDDWSGPNEAYFVPSYPMERAEQDYRATMYHCQLNATIDRAVTQRWEPFAEQRAGIAVAGDNQNDDDDDDENDDHASDGEERAEYGARTNTHHGHEQNGGLYMYHDDANPHYYDPYSEPSPPHHHNHNQQLSPSLAPWNRTSPLHRTRVLTTAGATARAQPRTVDRDGSAPANARDGAGTTTSVHSKNDAKALPRGRKRGIVLEEESSWREAAERLFEERNRLQECICLLMEQACCDAELDDDRAGDDVRRLEGVVGAMQQHKEERDKRKEEELQKQREAEAAAAKAAANVKKAKAKRERRKQKRNASGTLDDSTEPLGGDAVEADLTVASKKRKASSTPSRKVSQIQKREKAPVTTDECAAAVLASAEAEAPNQHQGNVAAYGTGPANETASPPLTGPPPDAAAEPEKEAEVVDLTNSPTTPPPASPLLDVASNS